MRTCWFSSPLEPFGTAVRNGTVVAKMKEILDALKPEAVYFSELNGHRDEVPVVDVATPSGVPRLAEPRSLSFNAEVELPIAMTPEDLGGSGLESLGKKWA